MVSKSFGWGGEGGGGGGGGGGVTPIYGVDRYGRPIVYGF